MANYDVKLVYVRGKLIVITDTQCGMNPGICKDPELQDYAINGIDDHEIVANFPASTPK